MDGDRTYKTASKLVRLTWFLCDIGEGGVARGQGGGSGGSRGVGGVGGVWLPDSSCDFLSSHSYFFR